MAINKNGWFETNDFYDEFQSKGKDHDEFKKAYQGEFASMPYDLKSYEDIVHHLRAIGWGRYDAIEEADKIMAGLEERKGDTK